MLWEDGAGHDRISNGGILDVSVAGLRVRVDERIPVRTYIFCNDHTNGISGRGSVRHCSFARGKYVIGIDFSGGTGWHEPSS